MTYSFYKLNENGVPAVSCLHYCPRFLADIYLVSNVSLSIEHGAYGYHVVWTFSLEYLIMMRQTEKTASFSLPLTLCLPQRRKAGFPDETCFQ